MSSRENEAVRKWREQVEGIYKEYAKQRQRIEDREWVLNEVMKRLNVKIVDEATPAIDDIAEQISRLIK